MATASSPSMVGSAAGYSSAAEERLAERERFRTSRFDLVTSLFLALIGFIGIFVTMLFILWLTTRDWSVPVIVVPPEVAAGRGPNAEGFERDFEPPGEEEVEELLEPTLADTIEAVTEAVSSVAAALVSADTDSMATTAGANGAGDNRPPGPEGEGDDIVPRFERWQLEFEARNAKAYAQQLDFYKIELGALGGGMKGVEIANNLSGSPSKRLLTDTKSEKRLYFMFNKPTPLQKFDTELLKKAGARTGAGRTVLKFIPPEVEEKLAALEYTYMKEHGHDAVKEVAKTVFKSEGSGGKYAFIVVSQRYRKPRW